jgi:hypothetical protein
MHRLACLALAAPVLLAGCVEETGSASMGMPSPAAQACLQAVTQQTGNGDVALISDSGFSEAGTRIVVGVGPQRAEWECFQYTDGSVGGITSLTDEGAL